MNTTSIRIASLLLLSAAAAACGADSSGYTPMRPIADGAAPADSSTPDDAPAPADSPAPDDAAPPPDDAPPPWMPPPGTDTSCVSGTRWTRGNHGSSSMNPGQACVACHARDFEAPRLSAAGTVYFLPHEVNNCNGYGGSAPGGPSGTAVVELVDATGRTVRISVNSAGNFYYRSSLSFPLRTARVIGPTGLVNEMGSPVPNGDCNGCHTQMGTSTDPGTDSAPGRITVPL